MIITSFIAPIASCRYRDWFFVAYFDLRPFVRSEAAMSIGTTAG